MTLNYFGSKKWLKEYINCILPVNTTILVSPFFGSGKIEYHIARMRSGIHVVGSDNFCPLINYHKFLGKSCFVKELSKFIDKTITPNIFDILVNKVTTASKLYSKCKLAALFYIVMRNSFYGSFGVYSKTAHVLTANVVAQSEKMQYANVKLSCKDVFDAIHDAKYYRGNVVMYLDPPYITTNLTGKYYAGEVNGDTKALNIKLASELCSGQILFMLSINDCACVRTLYKGCVFIKLLRPKFGFLKKKNAQLLILGPPGKWPENVRSRCKSSH
jgi:site-specific DNA-adenine methylase